MASSAVDIVNWALSKLGHEPYIVSLTDGSTAANIASQVYTLTRDALLREHPWRFAKKRAQLAPSATALLFSNNEMSFPLPSDFLFIVETDYVNTYGYTPWRREGNAIISSENPFNLIYISDPGVPNYDPLFVETLACKLALEMAVKLSRDKFPEVEKMYARSIMMSKNRGAIETAQDYTIAQDFLANHS